jgi:hypothetical protein
VALQRLGCYLCAVTLLLIGCCIPVSASVVLYTDRNAWLSATSSVNNIDFEGLTPAGTVKQYNGGSNSNSLIVGSDTFQGFDNSSATSYDLEVNNNIHPNWSSGAVLQGPSYFGSSSRVEAALPAGVFAVGSDVMLYDGNSSVVGGTMTVLLSTGPTTYSAPTSGVFSSRAFIGFVSDTPITKITFFPPTDPTAHVILDNFATGGQAATTSTPEATTLILCGSGLILMIRRLRRPSPFVTANARA